METTGSGVVAEKLEGGAVLRVRLDAPKGNILSTAVLEAIERELEAAAGDPALKLVLLTAKGRDFSFGASVAEHQREQAPKMLATFHRVVRQVGRSSVPVAAAVQGRCLGGALELVLACHFVLAAPDAVFACPEVKLGVLPPVLAALGPAKLLPAVAERLVITGDEIDAGAAAMAGLVSVVVSATGELEAAALAWFQKTLAPLSAFAIREATTAVRERSPIAAALGEGLDVAERRYLERILPSHDGNEGIAAFLERRRATWRNE